MGYACIVEAHKRAPVQFEVRRGLEEGGFDGLGRKLRAGFDDAIDVDGYRGSQLCLVCAAGGRFRRRLTGAARVDRRKVPTNIHLLGPLNDGRLNVEPGWPIEAGCHQGQSRNDAPLATLAIELGPREEPAAVTRPLRALRASTICFVYGTVRAIGHELPHEHSVSVGERR
jgi:hypothetical protein